MPLVTVKDKFQVTIPARLRDRIPIQVGDLLEVTVHEDGILLRPKAVVDRAPIADELDAVLRRAATPPADASKTEQAILEEAVEEVAAARAARGKRKG